ncbi:PepSY domain-containing protein [Sphingomonas sp. LaA6.9]|uniref:PepSY domain-containing protein n=1 Tax=Sphingomonas sp. LaA6.9 TaxID=2919914 RepID=UPI001F503471|nr:PepSY domain-containing protein [Sphingomonas sp. LaA6.9]MCJ8157260.1 PepSY domain-containing protein [Sphingomonas sp. LaA6.9]
MTTMNRLFSPLAAAIGATLLMGSAAADARRGDQDSAYEARQKGQVMSLREIESRVLPSARGAEYLGPEFDRARSVYRLKFRRDVQVFWVDVDARNGQVIGRSGR